MTGVQTCALPIFPLVSLIRNGVFDKDVHISYDSSSLTISFTMGFYHFDTYWCKEKLSKGYDETFMRMYEDVSAKSMKYFDVEIDRTDLFNMLCLSKGDADRGDHPEKYVANAAVLLNSVLNFNYLLDRLTTNDKVYHDYVASREHNLASLKVIKSKDDFYRWKKEYGRLFKSQPVGDIQSSSSLEGFFA